ncbi:MAG TPA: hypothetical protein ENK79_01165 [Campylobacterales bacterium]|nr:hypothetical protein [Campylobacterales bacterium]
MKKKLLILSLLLITGCIGFNEEKKEPKKTEERVNIVNIVKNRKNYTKKQLELKKYFDEYLVRLNSLDTEGVIDMTYPKLFIPINKTIFKQYINNVLTSDQISIESYDTNITDIGKVQSYDNGEFAKLKYKATITLGFINPNLYSDELSIRVLNNILSEKYGQENIQIDSTNRVITIHEEQKLLAIKDNNSNEEWKFIGDNPEYRKLYPEILPKEILSQI